jgi:NTE family protein
MAQVTGYRGSAELHVVPPLCPLVVSPADFTQTATLLARARESTQRWLAGSDAVDVEGVLALHTHHGPPHPAVDHAPFPQEGLTR